MSSGKSRTQRRRSHRKEKEDYYVVGSLQIDPELSGVPQSIERFSLVRKYAEKNCIEPVCQACLNLIRAELEKKVKAARLRASQYVASECNFKLDLDLKGREPRISRLVNERKALVIALDQALNEARRTRESLDALEDAEIFLDERQTQLCHRANCLELQGEHFRHACALIVANAERQSRHDLKLHSLANSLSRLNPDKASFASIDAYIRETARALNTIFGTASTPGTSSLPLGDSRQLQDNI